MKTKRKTILIAGLILLLAFSSAGCHDGSAGYNGSGKNDTITSAASDLFSNVGKTLNRLKRENPNWKYVQADIPDAAAECIGAPDSGYAYYFFGTQSGPNLQQMADTYGDQLKCAGISSAVNVLFPHTVDNMSFADFFASVGVTSYQASTNLEQDGPDFGWIVFTYNGMTGYLHFSDNYNGNGADVAQTIQLNDSVVLVDTTVEKANGALWDQAFKTMSVA